MQNSKEGRDIERKYNEARQVIQEWIDKQGHDKCWYYPDLFRRLIDVFEIKQTMEQLLPPREEFLNVGCKRYEKEIYDDGKY